MPEALYLLPNADEALLQGDIFLDVPFVWVPERPLLVARFLGENKKRVMTYAVHKEAEGPTSHQGTGRPPKGGFRLTDRQKPELALVPVILAMGMVLTHDCEIENDPDHRVVAMVRPITDLQPVYQQKCLAGERTDMFPLESQDQAPAMPSSFVDFRKTTPLRPGALAPPAVRHASISQELRDAVAGAYWNYLHHPFQEPRPPLDA